MLIPLHSTFINNEKEYIIRFINYSVIIYPKNSKKYPGGNMSKNNMDVVIETAKTSDAIQIVKLYDIVYNSNYPLTDFTKKDSIEKLINHPDKVWFLLKHDSCVRGSIVGSIDRDHKRAEIGQLAIYPEFETRGYPYHMIKRTQDKLLEEEVEVIWAAVRNVVVDRVSSRFGMSVGYLNGAHRVETREVHFLNIMLTKKAKDKRVVPPLYDDAFLAFGNVYNLRGVQDIIRAYELNNEEEPYPREVIISGTMDSYKGASEYQEAIILADKSREIAMFFELGFKITAFMPAWYENNGKRYDCVMLGNAIVQASPTSRRSGKKAQEFAAGFEEVIQDAC